VGPAADLAALKTFTFDVTKNVTNLAFVWSWKVRFDGVRNVGHENLVWATGQIKI
jgi:hypothetical protein